MKDQLATVLDKSLKSHGVQLTNKELLPVVGDLVAFFEGLQGSTVASEVPATPPPTEFKPIPVTGKV